MVIWTKHALQRLADRQVNQKFIMQAYNNPDSTKPGKQAGTTEFIKRIGKYTITLIAQKNEKDEWIIISFWVEPPFAGSVDITQKKKYWEYQKASSLKKIWLIVKDQFGF